MADLPAAAWDAPSRTSKGVVESSRDAVLSRWREVVVHHGDLGLARCPSRPRWSTPGCRGSCRGWRSGADPAELLAWVIGRGDPPELAPW